MTGGYWIETWGCQMNEHDSEKMAGTLEALGYVPAAAAAEADVVLLNTCAIREKAAERVHHYLDQLRPALAGRRDVLVGVCGCVAQLEGDALLARGADLVLGPRAASRLAERLGDAKARRGIVDTTLYPDSLALAVAARRQEGRVKAFVTIMEGCSKSCAYCVVPTTRGREASRAMADVLAEVGRAAAQGHPEIEFLGQNVNAWRCPETGAQLGDLLRAAGAVPGVRRLRFTTSHPLQFGTPLIEAMAETPQVCEALHLPVQSGSSRILKAMRRGYDRDRYMAKVDELRKRIPGIALSTDVIVGFPGETEDDFAETLSLVREVGFDQMFSFVFSPRPNTVAAMMRDDTPAERKNERLTELQTLQMEIQRARGEAYLGRTLEVLVESKSRRDDGEWAGRGRCGRVVNFAADGVAPGDVVEVRVTATGPVSLRGELAAAGRGTAAETTP